MYRLCFILVRVWFVFFFCFSWLFRFFFLFLLLLLLLLMTNRSPSSPSFLLRVLPPLSSFPRLFDYVTTTIHQQQQQQHNVRWLLVDQSYIFFSFLLCYWLQLLKEAPVLGGINSKERERTPSFAVFQCCCCRCFIRPIRRRTTEYITPIQILLSTHTHQRRRRRRCVATWADYHPDSNSINSIKSHSICCPLHP